MYRGPRRYPASIYSLVQVVGNPLKQHKEDTHDLANHGPQQPNFRNTKVALRSKTNRELFRGWLVLKLCSSDIILQNYPSLIKGGQKLLGKALFKHLMKKTFYGQFVAGENELEIEPVLQRMRMFGVNTILDYSAENDLSNENGDNNGNNHKASPTDVDLGSDQQKALELVAPPVVPKSLGPEMNLFSHRSPYADYLARSHKATVRTYVYKSEEHCDTNAEIFCKCIRAVASATDHEGFAAIKMTALCEPQLLQHLSEILQQTWAFYRILSGSTQQELVKSKVSKQTVINTLKEFGISANTAAVQEWFEKLDFNHDGNLDVYKWSQLIENLRLTHLFKIFNLSTGRMENLIDTLTPLEEEQFANLIKRLKKIAECAKSNKVRLMIDAEQTYFQPAINRLTIELMRKYNREHAAIFGTYQCYLRNVEDALHVDLYESERENFYFGAKIVRGAYMEQERKVAVDKNADDPIQQDYDATTESYKRVLKIMFEEIKRRDRGKMQIMVATHNEDAVMHTVDLMRIYGVNPSENVVSFGQLYGMSDQITFSLGQGNYSAFKYVPYGPVDEVLPYISRRASENSSMLAKATIDRNLMWRELWRRIFSGQWFHHPTNLTKLL